MACNADMRPADVRKYCKLDDAGSALIRPAMTQLQLSARAFHRVLKLARTIADLDGPLLIANDPYVGLRCDGVTPALPDLPGPGVTRRAMPQIG